FFSSRIRHTIFSRDWSSDVCSSDLAAAIATVAAMPVFAYAQAHADHAGHAPVPATAHGMSAMDHGSGEMDHGDMQMQGGSAPPEDRKSVVKEKVLKMLYSVSLRGKR